MKQTIDIYIFFIEDRGFIDLKKCLDLDREFNVLKFDK